MNWWIIDGLTTGIPYEYKTLDASKQKTPDKQIKIQIIGKYVKRNHDSRRMVLLVVSNKGERGVRVRHINNIQKKKERQGILVVYMKKSRRDNVYNLLKYPRKINKVEKEKMQNGIYNRQWKGVYEWGLMRM